MSQVKLARTQSSLLRSSPTVRSSIHSLSSINEACEVIDDSEEEKKPRKRLVFRRNPVFSSSRFRAVASFVLCPVLYFSVFLIRRSDVPASEYFLLVLVFIAFALFLIAKNKVRINHSFAFLKQLCSEHSKKLRIYGGQPKSVQWFIGEGTSPPRNVTPAFDAVREGVEFYSNGDFYEGEFHRGKCNGSGVYSYFVNGRYEGDWVDGRYDGYGVESWAKGSRYRGHYHQGLRHGFGVYKFYTGDSYAGEWFHGQSQGVGVQTCSDGSSFAGEFKCGVKHGLGFYRFRNGDKYAGEYFGDKIQGFGVYHFGNGHCYEGSWHEGRKQGYGVYTFRNGEAKRGEWDRGVLRYPLPLSTNAVVRAVQGARKVAEKAVSLGGVGEEVSRAAMAANRAATAARVAAIRAVQNRIYEECV